MLTIQGTENKCFWSARDSRCGEQFPLGVTTLEYITYDRRGNSAVCTFNITVNDFDECKNENPFPKTDHRNSVSKQLNGGCGDPKQYRCFNVIGEKIGERVTDKGGYYDGEQLYQPDCENICNDNKNCTSCMYGGIERAHKAKVNFNTMDGVTYRSYQGHVTYPHPLTGRFHRYGVGEYLENTCKDNNDFAVGFEGCSNFTANSGSSTKPSEIFNDKCGRGKSLLYCPKSCGQCSRENEYSFPAQHPFVPKNWYLKRYEPYILSNGQCLNSSESSIALYDSGSSSARFYRRGYPEFALLTADRVRRRKFTIPGSTVIEAALTCSFDYGYPHPNYIHDGQCLSRCPNNTFSHIDEDPNVNPQCKPCTPSCPPGFYETRSCSHDHDRTCEICTECQREEFRFGGCSGTVDSICKSWNGLCQTNQFEERYGDAVNNRKCTDCRLNCSEGEFEDVKCRGSEDLRCKRCVDNCAICDGPDSDCTKCFSGFLLQNGVCVSPFDCFFVPDNKSSGVCPTITYIEAIEWRNGLAEKVNKRLNGLPSFMGNLDYTSVGIKPGEQTIDSSLADFSFQISVLIKGAEVNTFMATREALKDFLDSDVKMSYNNKIFMSSNISITKDPLPGGAYSGENNKTCNMISKADCEELSCRPDTRKPASVYLYVPKLNSNSSSILRGALGHYDQLNILSDKMPVYKHRSEELYMYFKSMGSPLIHGRWGISSSLGNEEMDLYTHSTASLPELINPNPQREGNNSWYVKNISTIPGGIRISCSEWLAKYSIHVKNFRYVCSRNQVWHDGKCVNTCGNGFQISLTKMGLMCLPCPSLCKTCSADRNTCVACVTGSSLQDDGSCTRACPIEYYSKSSVETNICTKCKNRCASNEYEAQNCSQTTNRECKECGVGCEVCATHRKKCLQCRDGLLSLPDGESCVKICPDGYFKFKNMCKLCNPFCEAGFFEASECTPFTNRRCEKCSSCFGSWQATKEKYRNIKDLWKNYQTEALPFELDHTFYKQFKIGGCNVGALGMGQDTICSDRTLCQVGGKYNVRDKRWENIESHGQFAFSEGDIEKDRVCLPCRTCRNGTYDTGGCDGDIDTICKSWEKCGNNKKYDFLLHPGKTDKILFNASYKEWAAPNPFEGGAKSYCSACKACDDGSFSSESCVLDKSMCTSHRKCIPEFEEVRAVGTRTSDAVCQPRIGKECSVISCPDGQYLETGMCEASSPPKGYCRAVREKCPAGAFQRRPPTNTSDRLCAECSTCDGLITEGSGNYKSKRCTATEDTQCTPWSSCPNGYFEVDRGTAERDTICAKCNTCDGPFFKSGGCISLSEQSLLGTKRDHDTICSPWRICTDLEFEIRAPTHDTDRVCKDCTACPVGFHKIGGCYDTVDTICEPHSKCPVSQFKIRDGNSVLDTECQACTTCPEGQYAKYPCSDFQDTICEFWSKCGVEDVEDFRVIPSPTKNRKCVSCFSGEDCDLPECDTRCRILRIEEQESNCTSGEYTLQNGSCATCKKCDFGEYNAGGCRASLDRECRKWSAHCPMGQYPSRLGSSSEDTRCSICSTCPDSFFPSGGCSDMFVVSNSLMSYGGGSQTVSDKSVWKMYSADFNNTFLGWLKKGYSSLRGDDTKCVETKKCFGLREINKMVIDRSKLADGAIIQIKTWVPENGTPLGAVPSYIFRTGNVGADVLCKQCTECPFGQFQYGGCSGVENTLCQQHTKCRQDQYEAVPPTKYSNRVCNDCHTCTGQTFKTGGCDGLTDTICTPWSLPQKDTFGNQVEFLIKPGTATTDRKFQKCKLCGINEISKEGSCKGTKNRECIKTLPPCNNGTREFRNDKEECVPCNACPIGFEEVGGCDGLINTVCRLPSEGCVDGYEFTRFSETKDNEAVCITCTPCSSNQFEVPDTCKGFYDRTCRTHRQCTQNEIRIQIGNSKTNTICNVEPPCLLSNGEVNKSLVKGDCVELNNAVQDDKTIPTWTNCNAGSYSYVALGPTPYNDRKCIPCRKTCIEGPGFYIIEGSCSKANSEEDAKCRQHTKCVDGSTYEELKGTDERDTVCKPCSKCGPGKYAERGSCKGNRNTKCVDMKSDCGDGKFLVHNENMGLYRYTPVKCEDCTPCRKDEYAEVVCDGKINNRCRKLTVCGVGEFESQAPTFQSDRKCSNCTTSCNPKTHFVKLGEECGDGGKDMRCSEKEICKVEGQDYVEWGPWSKCVGNVRSRNAVIEKNLLADEEVCFTNPNATCKYIWRSWSPCIPYIGQCGSGFQKRLGDLIEGVPHGPQCVGSKEQGRACNVDCSIVPKRGCSLYGRKIPEGISLAAPRGYFRDGSKYSKCTKCPAGKYEESPCMKNIDTVCTEAKSQSCNNGDEYLVPASSNHEPYCQRCSICAFGSYKKGGCIGTQDTTCEPWRICRNGEYESLAPTHTTNRQCTKCNQCSVGKYAASGCRLDSMDPSQDVVCIPWRICSIDSEFETKAPTSTSDRECQTCSTCLEGTHKEGGCDGVIDTICVIDKSCSALEYTSHSPTALSDRICTACNMCPAGQFSNGCDGNLNGGCREYSVCIERGMGNFRLHDGTKTTDVECGKCPPSRMNLVEFQFHFANKYNYTLALKNQQTGFVRANPSAEDLLRFVDDLRQHLNSLFFDEDQFCFYNITKISSTDTNLGMKDEDRLIEVTIDIDMTENSDGLQAAILKKKVDENSLRFFYTRTGERGTRRIAMRTVPGSFGKTVKQYLRDNFIDLVTQKDKVYSAVEVGGQLIEDSLRTYIAGSQSELMKCSKEFFLDFERAELAGQTFSEATITALRASAPHCYRCSVVTGFCKDNYDLGIEHGLAEAKTILWDEITSNLKYGWEICRNISWGYRKVIELQECPVAPTTPPKRLETTILPYIYATEKGGRILSDEEEEDLDKNPVIAAASGEEKVTDDGDLLGTGSRTGSIAIIVCVCVLILLIFVGMILVRSRMKKQRRISQDRRKSLARVPLKDDNHVNSMMWENPLFKEDLSAEHALNADHLDKFRVDDGDMYYESQLHEEVVMGSPEDLGYMTTRRQADDFEEYTALNDPNGEKCYLESNTNNNNFEAEESQFVLEKPLRKSVMDKENIERKSSIDSIGSMYERDSITRKLSTESSMSGMYDESLSRRSSTGLKVSFENPNHIGELLYESDDEELQLTLGPEMNEDTFFLRQMEEQVGELGNDRSGQASMMEMQF
eukprot:UC4_evm5s1019